MCSMLVRYNHAGPHAICPSLRFPGSLQGLATGILFVSHDPLPSVTVICDPHWGQSGSLLKPGSGIQHFSFLPEKR